MAAGLLTAALGVGLLVRAQAGSGYRTLLPALLLWGIGLGVLTPAVVAAAVRAVPARRRARLGRQQHRPSGRRGDRDRRLRGHRRQRRPGRALVAGLHTDALIAVGLWLAVTAAVLSLVPPGSRGPEPVAGRGGMKRLR